MKFLIPLAVFFLLKLFFWWLGQDDNGGWFGSKVRSSNWSAWHDAIKDKQRKIQQLESEIEEIKKVEPQRPKNLHSSWLD